MIKKAWTFFCSHFLQPVVSGIGLNNKEMFKYNLYFFVSPQFQANLYIYLNSHFYSKNSSKYKQIQAQHCEKKENFLHICMRIDEK